MWMDGVFIKYRAYCIFLLDRLKRQSRPWAIGRVRGEHKDEVPK